MKGLELLGFLLVVFATVGFVTFTVFQYNTRESERYWQAYNECLKNGGSVIPVVNGGNSAIMCLGKGATVQP